MELLRVVYRQYRWPFVAVMALTMASSALGIGIIAFINLRLMTAAGDPLADLRHGSFNEGVFKRHPYSPFEQYRLA